MAFSRRGLLATGLALLAGCGSPDADVATGSTDPGARGATCETPTPVPVPDLTIRNEREAPVTVAVVIYRVATSEESPGSEPLYQTHPMVDPGTDVDAADVFPADGRYEIHVALSDGTQTSERFDVTADSRRAVIVVEVDDGVDVGRLHVVPQPTATGCPDDRASPTRQGP